MIEIFKRFVVICSEQVIHDIWTVIFRCRFLEICCRSSRIVSWIACGVVDHVFGTGVTQGVIDDVDRHIDDAVIHNEDGGNHLDL